MGLRKRTLKIHKFERPNRLVLQLVLFAVGIWTIYIVSVVLLVLVWLFPNELVGLLNRLSVGSAVGWEPALVPIRSVAGDVLNFTHIKVWTMDEKIAIVDKLMVEFRLEHWCDEKIYRKWRAQFIGNFVTPEMTRLEFEVLQEKLFSNFSATVDEIYKISGWRPVPSLETRKIWFDKFETLDHFMYNLRKAEMLKHPGNRRSWGGWR